MLKPFAIAALALLASATATFATPTLRPAITVTGPIVTVGDLFDDAGPLAATPLFRAPNPGTTGSVSIVAIAGATDKVGLKGYLTGGLASVEVSRAASQVDDQLLAGLIAQNVNARGLAPSDATITARFDAPVSIKAEASDTPATLLDLAYQPGGKAFSARFQIAGSDQPLTLTGRIDLTVSVPHLVNTLTAGTILSGADIEMQDVPLEFADRTGIEGIDQLVGKALKRNARAGLLLRSTDVEEPVIIRRNAAVTVELHTGPMVLTMQGSALGDASIGATVQVMNSVTHKILTGVATANGTVEVITGAMKVAGL